MSMDLNFWRYKENTAHDHAAVYQTACCEGDVMEELEMFPIDEILKKVAAAFSDWTIHKVGKDFGCPLYDPQIRKSYNCRIIWQN